MRACLRLLSACTDHPKSAIFKSPFMPRSRFSGLMSRWMTCFEWQYCSAPARDAMYLHAWARSVLSASPSCDGVDRLEACSQRHAYFLLCRLHL